MHGDGNDAEASLAGAQEGDEDEVVETDPSGRYQRFREVVGKGRFKCIYKAFDSQMGMDVAWSKISADTSKLSQEQVEKVLEEMEKQLELEHVNIIKCFKCWLSHDQHCINLITELFTSGNLRLYRNMHKHLDLKALKRMAKQILRGLQYLHEHDPPMTHGDLRCDKIYVNGHSGEIKIGDLGLTALMPKRWENSSPSQPAAPENSMASDIFAFGLCMLELITLKQLDQQHCADWEATLAEVADEDARVFISKCLGPASERPSAGQLLDDPFLLSKKTPTALATGEARSTGDHGEPSVRDGGASARGGVYDTEAVIRDRSGALDPEAGGDGATEIKVGLCRGEDYSFEFSGVLSNGKMQVKLIMRPQDSGDAPSAAEPGSIDNATIADFPYDPDVDTTDQLAQELAQEFGLSQTDTEICAAALREWLAKEMPGFDSSGK